MKKLFLALCLVLGFTVSSFAYSDDLVSISASFPKITDDSSTGSLDFISFDVHGLTMESQKVGFEYGASVGKAKDLNNTYLIELNAGIAIMPYNGDLISFVIAPGGDFNIITYSGLNIWDIGVGCDFTLNFKLLDGLYITGAMNFVYYFYKGVSDSSIRSDNKSYTFAPRIGISIID